MSTLPDIRRVLVLGHSGFIGRQVIAALRDLAGPDRSGCEIAGLSYPEIDLANAESIKKLNRVLDSGTAVVFLSGIKRQLGDDDDIFRRTWR